jgi:hypothetical protein
MMPAAFVNRDCDQAVAKTRLSVRQNADRHLADVASKLTSEQIAEAE